MLLLLTLLHKHRDKRRRDGDDSGVNNGASCAGLQLTEHPNELKNTYN